VYVLASHLAAHEHRGMLLYLSVHHSDVPIECVTMRDPQNIHQFVDRPIPRKEQEDTRISPDINEMCRELIALLV